MGFSRRERLPTPVLLGFPGGSVGKESKAGKDLGEEYVPFLFFHASRYKLLCMDLGEKVANL